MATQQSFNFDTATTSITPSELKLMFERWVTWRTESSRPLRPESIDVYSAMWSSITKYFIRRDIDPLRAGTGDIKGLVISLGCSLAYQKRILILLDEVLRANALTAYNSQIKPLIKDPLYRYAANRSVDKLPVTLNRIQEHELIRLLHARVKEGSWKRQRDIAMLATMLASGIKPGEALDLQIDQIRFKGIDSTQGIPEKFSLSGNGNNGARECPISQWGAVIVGEWLQTRHALRIDFRHVFPGSLVIDRPIGKATFYRQFNKLLDEIGIVTPKRGTHLLRHTFAVSQLEHGKKLVTVRDWLGLEATESALMYESITR